MINRPEIDENNWEPWGASKGIAMFPGKYFVQFVPNTRKNTLWEHFFPAFLRKFTKTVNAWTTP